MLVDKANVLAIDMNNPQAQKQLESISAKSGAHAADLVITNCNTKELHSYFNKERIVQIPSIHFGGFHPDVVYFATRQNPEMPIFFLKNPTVSAIALWGFLSGLSEKDTLSLYCEDVFEKIRYFDYFDVSSVALISSYKELDIDTKFIERHLASREVFMYGPLHPKLSVILSLCFGVCEKLDIKPVTTFDSLNNMLPDPLENEYAWSCFPPLASRLGVPGGWTIRHFERSFIKMEQYLALLYKGLAQHPKNSLQFLERDRLRFESFHNISNLLGSENENSIY